MTQGEEGLVGPKQTYCHSRRVRWDKAARERRVRRGAAAAYHGRLLEVYRFLVPPGSRVLELGCGTGDLLAGLQPSRGVGVDFSPEMLALARERHPALEFLQGDVHDLELSGKFDFIILSDLVNDLWDVQRVLARVSAVCQSHTRVVVNLYSRLWELPLLAVQKLGLAQPVLYQNWLTPEDMTNLFALTGLEVMRHFQEVLLPLKVPLLGTLANRYLVKLWPFRVAALTNFLVARPAAGQRLLAPKPPTVTVVVAARNEAGNIERIFAETPELGGGTELLFVEGHSTDDTYQTIERVMKAHPERNARLFRQKGEGKGDAVRLGFSQARGDILMILDADLTVPPEDLPRFYEALVTGKGEFINGVRLVYPMEERAMRFLNLLGNKFFSLAFSWLLGQSIKDTLCGTKVLWRADYERIAAHRAYFGDFDPFGDFDLLFGAAKLNLRIVDLPVRYRERTYGSTNIQRWRHGWLLLKMVAFAASRIKFV